MGLCSWVFWIKRLIIRVLRLAIDNPLANNLGRLACNLGPQDRGDFDYDVRVL